MRDRVRRIAGLVVLLADAREHEDLVVHRDPEQEREDHDRDPRDDRVGRLDSPDRVRAMAVLEDEHDDPVCRAQRDQVQQHGLQRQQDRAECASQQDVREDQDEEQDVRELAVDGVHEVPVLRSNSAERHLDASRVSELGSGVVTQRLDLREDVILQTRDRPARGPGVRVIGAKGLDEPRAARPPGRRCRRPGDSWRLADRIGDAGQRRGRGSVPDENDVRQVEPVRHSSGCHGRPTGARVALRRLLVQLGVTRVDVERRRQHDRDDDRARHEDERRPPLHDPAPAAPEPFVRRMRLHKLLRHHPHAIDPGPEQRQHRRQKSERGKNGDERDQHPTEAD